MKNKKRIVVIAAVVTLVCLFAALAACSRRDGTEPAGAGSADKRTYTITIKTEAGGPVAGIGVYVYEDSTCQELVWFAKTDEQGSISFTDGASDSYVAVISEPPTGFEAEEQYPLTGELTEIVLASGMATAEDLENMTYKLGDTMLDFTVTAPDGTEYTPSELLKDKKAVVLNFWYVECQPCKNEFPYLQAAYMEYGEDVAVLAMNPVNTDEQAIAALQEELGLTFPMVRCDSAWAKAMQLSAYPTTVVIDRYGVISLIHKGSITEENVFESIFAFFASEEYEQTTVQSLEDIPMLALPGSNADDPIEIGGVTSFEVTVEPGQLVYYNIYKVNGMYLQIRNEDAYAIYKNVTYEPNGGSVGFSVTAPDTYTPVSVAFGNSGKKAVTYTVTLSAPKGTVNNPYTLELGEFTTAVSAGNNQGVYYTFTAPESGTLNLKCLSISSNVDYDITLYNINTNAFRNIGEDGSYKQGVSVKVNQGDTVKVIISTLPDSSFSYPAATLTTLASMSEATEEEEEETVETVTYAITVTNENRVPVPNVYLYVDVNGKATAIKTNEKGIASIKLEKGTYTVTLAVPSGYKANTTVYQLSEARPNFSIKMDTVAAQTYTVKAVDESGAPVADVLVTIGDSYAYTDASGKAVFRLEKGNYTAVIVPPEGYTCDETSVAFPKNQTELTVTLREGSGSGDSGTKIQYKVTVRNYDGTPCANVMVQFRYGATVVAAKVTDSNGVASVKLEPGNYTATLAFSGEALYYDKSAAVLSQSASSITITVVEGISSEVVELYVGNAYYVDAGGTYVKLQSNLINYYLFEPTVAGVYRISTSDPAAVLSYWGGSVFFINEQPDKVDSATNTITLNIKESNLGGTHIIGITGASECVLEIVRIGDPILDETDIVPEVWEGEDTPSSVFKVTGVSGKKLTYLDLTAKTSAYKLVYSASDGYYHLNSASGPVLYVNLGPDAPYISMYVMLGYTGYGGTSLNQSFYDDDGNVVRREDYTTCMCSYVECIDETYGVYPLNDDLIYMFQQGGDYKGWWDSSSGNYMFGELSGLNEEIAWMFAVCYFK